MQNSTLNSKRFLIRKSLIGSNTIIKVKFKSGKEVTYNHDEAYKIMQAKLEVMPCFIKYNKMENYKEFYVTGFNKLKETIEEIENDPRVEDYDEYCEERHDDQENNVYYVQVIYK